MSSHELSLLSSLPAKEHRSESWLWETKTVRQIVPSSLFPPCHSLLLFSIWGWLCLAKPTQEISSSRLPRFSGKESDCQHRSWGFSPWVGKIPWRRKWQPTPVFFPGKSYGRRNLAGYSPWGRRVGHRRPPQFSPLEGAVHSSLRKPKEGHRCSVCSSHPVSGKCKQWTKLNRQEWERELGEEAGQRRKEEQSSPGSAPLFSSGRRWLC